MTTIMAMITDIMSISSKQKSLSPPLPPRALASGGEGSGVGGLSAADAARGMAEMSDKFNAMGQQVYVAADAVKAPHTTALDTEAEHQARNAELVKESNKAL